MALTITKMTNGYFLFESNEQKKGAAIARPRQTNNQIEFFDMLGDYLAGPTLFSNITVMNGLSEVTGLNSAELVMDALAGLGMFPTVTE